MKRQYPIPRDKHRPNQMPDIRVVDIDPIHEQSDWAELDERVHSFIRNKPTILNPVQSDWDVTDTTSLAYILNKPDLASTALLEDVVATVEAGAIDAGETAFEGTTFTDFVKQLLIKTLYPTFTAPSATRVSNPSSGSAYESGTTVTWRYTVNFNNRGSIWGKIVGGIWFADEFQDYRAGVAASYTIDGINTGLTNYREISQLVADGNTTRTGFVNHEQGPQPYDSDGEPYGLPLPPGTLSAGSAVLVGRRKWFAGGSLNHAPDSAVIRALAASSLIASTPVTGAFTVAAGSTIAIIAYPGTNNLDYIKQVSGGVEINVLPAWSGPYTASVEGADEYTAIPYTFYTFVPDTPYPFDVDYIFKTL